MEFITLEEYKDFEGIKSPEDNVRIQFLVDSVNSQVSGILGADELTDYTNKTTRAPINIILDTDAKARDIVVTDEEGEPLEGLTGGKGYYTFTNEYIGIVNFTLPNRFLVVPNDIKLATAQLIRYYRSNEYKASISGAGQSVAYVSLTSNIPRHVMSVLAIYRRL